MVGFEYVKHLILLTDTRNIQVIIFDISRYGKYSHAINFNVPVSEKEAIKKIEKYLSEPITEYYFNKVKDDLFENDLEYNELSEKGYKCRGDLLTDASFLEEIKVVKEGVVIVKGGS